VTMYGKRHAVSHEARQLAGAKVGAKGTVAQDWHKGSLWQSRAMSSIVLKKRKRIEKEIQK